MKRKASPSSPSRRKAPKAAAVAAAPEPLEMAVAAARAADERKGEDVLILDLRGRSPVADFFVIVSGKVEAHLASIGAAVAERLAALGCRPLSMRESAGLGGWALMDYGPVVVHAFLPEVRAYYDLDLLWGDVPRVKWQEPGGAAPAGA